MIEIATFFILAATIYQEGRGESVEGQKAIAKVILNRAYKEPAPPGEAIPAVIYRKLQFSCWNNGNRPSKIQFWDTQAMLKAMAVAADALEEWSNGDRLSGADHYYNPTLANPSWAKSMKVIAVIGNHRFLKS